MLTSRASHLRELMNRETIAVPGAFNAFSARLIERAGFSAVYVSGAGLSASRALPDIELLTMAEVVMEARHIAGAVELPVLADADTGFGDIHQVYRTVQEFESAGTAGIHIEDQTSPKRCGHLDGKRVISTAAMCAKIMAAVRARRDSNFLIIARTDARAIEGLDGAIARAKAYVDAGADAIFPEALESKKEFRLFAEALAPSPPFLIANMTEWGKTPLLAVREFSDFGYHLVLFPMTLFRAMAGVLEDTLRELKIQGTQKTLLGRLQTREELYDVLRYPAFLQFERHLQERQVANESTHHRTRT